jgi:hypothetical protein
MAYIIGQLTAGERRALEKLGWEFESATKVADEIKTPEAGKLCPLCNQAKIEDNGEIAFCPHCDHRWASRQTMVGCWVDNDVYAIMTGPDWQTDDTWANDLVQFARLLAEIQAVGISRRRMDLLCESMDLPPERVNELFERADRAWERAKTVYAPAPEPPDFEEEMRLLLFDRGLEAEDILQDLDPDTAGVDLINLVKKLMETRTVYCKFCHEAVSEVGAHRHDGGWVGDCCWDERLRSTE